jgi:hypothetical protein
VEGSAGAYIDLGIDEILLFNRLPIDVENHFAPSKEVVDVRHGDKVPAGRAVGDKVEITSVRT